jgi:CRISPR-associated endonuclease/helicase Cas3
VWAARRWLRSLGGYELTDAEGQAAPGEESTEGGQRALRWRGAEDEATRAVQPGQIRPGDTLVVPAARGGCDDWGWDPDSPAPVSDLAEDAALLHRRRLVLRLAETTFEVACASPSDGSPEPPPWSRIAEAIEQHEGARDLISVMLGFEGLPERWKKVLKVLQRKRPRRVPCYGPAGHAVLVAERPVLDSNTVADILDISARGVEPPEVRAATEGNHGSFGSAQEVPLDRHLCDAGKKAAEFATCIGLSAARIADLTLAGRLHDMGKVEHRFQAYLRGGDEFAALAASPIAKSGTRPNPVEHERARERAGLPKGARHEAWSVHMARADGSIATAGDKELVLLLIGTHHGHGRPFFPPAEYPAEGETPDHTVPVWRLDADWPGLFAKLKRRYGVWGLAHLEAVLRLADHHVSAAYEREEAQ